MLKTVALTLILYCNVLYADSILILANPAPMSVTTPAAGQQPGSATDSSTGYTVSTTLTVTKITGQLDSNMPTGVTLSVQLTPPPGATGQGSVPMTTTAADLVTNIPTLTLQVGLTITYTLAATVNASIVSNGTRTLTLTLQ